MVSLPHRQAGQAILEDTEQFLTKIFTQIKEINLAITKRSLTLKSPALRRYQQVL
jgi:hypothetical protein